MKTRIGITIAMLGVTVIHGIPLVRAQQPSQTSTRPAQPRAPLPSLPNAPSLPSEPSLPNVPSLPSEPSLPNVPNLPNVDPLGDVMFPPDLIMRHARQLGLTDEQKRFMRGEIQRTTTSFIELQWQLQDAMEALNETMKSNSVNEQQALVQLDKVLDAEREIKRLHIGMGIRIKNQLTPEQQAKLHGMRMTSRPHGHTRAMPGEQP